MDSRSEVPAELFWFLGALGTHLLTCVALFSILWAVPDGPVARAAATLFDVLAYPEPLPLSSLLWAAVIATAVAVARRVRRTA